MFSHARESQHENNAQVDKNNNQIKKVEATVQEAEAERQIGRKEYEGVISERDILGTQLIRRNDELALLHEKVRILQGTLEKGQISFGEKEEELR